MTKPNPFLEKTHAKNDPFTKMGYKSVAKEKVKTQPPMPIKTNIFSRKTRP